MVTSKSLREERMNLQKTLEGMLSKAETENRDLDAAEKQNYDKLISDDNALRSRIERLEESEKRSKEFANYTNDPGLGEFPAREIRDSKRDDWEKREKALEAWARTGMITDELRSKEGEGIDLPLFNDWEARNFQRAALERRDMGVGSQPQLIAEGFSYEIERSMLAVGDLLKVARTYRTVTGNPIPWPTSDDTANSGVMLSENNTIGTSVEPTVSSVTLNSYEMSSQAVLVSNRALRDFSFDWAGVIGEDLGTRLGRIINSYGTTGTGTSQPQGIVTGSSLGVTTAAAGTVTFDDIIDLKYSVDPAYWKSASVGWMMHAQSVGALRKLKDGHNQYLWRPSVVLGAPDTIDGHPVYLNQYMDIIGDVGDTTDTGEKPILFGDFSKFIYRIVSNVRSVRLNERYADKDQTGFISYIGMDTRLLNSSAVRHLLVQ